MLHCYAGVNLAVADLEGRVILTAGPAPKGVLADALQQFAASEHPMEISEDRYFSRITNRRGPACIIAAYGKKKPQAEGESFKKLVKQMLWETGAEITREDFFRKLLSKEMVLSEIIGCAAELDLDLDRSYIVYCLSLSEECGAATEDLLYNRLRLAVAYDTVVYQSRQPIVVHCVGKDPGQEETRIRALEEKLIESARIIKGKRIDIGKSGTVHSLDLLADAYAEAQEAIETGRAFKLKDDIFRYDHLILQSFARNLPQSSYLCFLKTSVNDPFYDEIDEETARTIETFLDNTMNVSKTSKQLYFHRNALRYKLDYIEGAAGLNLRDFNEASIFKMGWVIHQYLKANE